MTYAKHLCFLGLCFLFLACNKATIKEQKLTISGSTTIGEHLMPQLVESFLTSQGIVLDTSEKKETQYIFKGRRTDTVFIVQIQMIGSKKGLDLLNKARSDIAMVSESQLIDSNTVKNFDTLRLASDSIVLIAHQYNPIQQLTKAQITAIFTGNIKTWQQLTPHYPFTINIHIRDTASGTSLSFKHLVLGNLDCSPFAKQHASNSDLLEDIKRDYYGIGYMSSSELTNTETFKLINVGNATFTRPLFLLSQKNKPPDLVKAFRDYCRSREARAIIEGQNFRL